MECPLFTIGRTDVQMGVESDYGECIKGECAWWHDQNQSCAILMLGQGMAVLHKALLDIECKMPHAGQFRR